MSKYMTVVEAAEKWGVSVQRVRTLCRDGRISGAKKSGKLYQIPAKAALPEDGRVHNGRGRSRFVKQVIEDVAPQEHIELETIKRCYEDAPNLFYVVDPKTRHVLYANRAIHNYINAPIEGLACYSCLIGLRSPCKDCGLNNIGKSHMHYHEKADRYFEAHTRNLVIDGKRYCGITCIDVTQRVRAKKQLEEERAKYRNLFNHVPAGIAILENKRGVVTFSHINSYLTKQCGYTDEELQTVIPQNLDGIIPKEDQLVINTEIAQAFKDHATHRVQFDFLNKGDTKPTRYLMVICCSGSTGYACFTHL